VEVIGRQGEMAGVDRFLGLLAAGPAALVLEGEPGIGKTTVWRAAVDAALARSYRVLVCRPSESERALSFLGLGDVLEGAGAEVLERLPEPQRLALEVALLRSAGEGSPDRVGVARGALGVLRAWAADTPTVVAIDDAQWLDPPSADVLHFVAHRMVDERLGFVVSARSGGATSLELDRAFSGGGLVRLWIEPLSLEELEEVVRLHLPVSFADRAQGRPIKSYARRRWLTVLCPLLAVPLLPLSVASCAPFGSSRPFRTDGRQFRHDGLLVCRRASLFGQGLLLTVGGIAHAEQLTRGYG
jgi:AAA ATPase domain